MDTIECMECHGKKQVDAFFLRHADGTCEPHRRIDCMRCDGSGVVPAVMAEWVEAGHLMKAERLSRRVGLSREAKQRGMPVSELSGMENGRIDPRTA